MKRFAIEWRGRITRDVGVDYLSAKSAEDAREKWLSKRGQIDELVAVSETEDELDWD